MLIGKRLSLLKNRLLQEAITLDGYQRRYATTSAWHLG